MSDYLYLYADPFVVRNNKKNKALYKLDYLDEQDREDEKRIHAIFLKFLIDEKVVDVRDENTILYTSQDNKGSWIYLTNYTNFRSLVDMNQYAKFMASLQSGDGNPIDRVIDLYTRLGILFDERVLNTVVHRTLWANSLIPYAVPENSTRIDWETIHTETPFLWVLILLQVIIVDQADRPA